MNENSGKKIKASVINIKKRWIIKGSWRNGHWTSVNQLGFLCHMISINDVISGQFSSIRFKKRNLQEVWILESGSSWFWISQSVRLICKRWVMGKEVKKCEGGLYLVCYMSVKIIARLVVQDKMTGRRIILRIITITNPHSPYFTQVHVRKIRVTELANSSPFLMPGLI